jgi:cation diffusion facilitator family transporter
MHQTATGLQPDEQLKRRAATVSLAYNVTLTLVKLIAALITGSVSLLSETIHSGTDIVASAIALVSVRAAAVPPDEEHPYGHGKIESLAGFGESVLLLLIVIYIVFESITRLISPAELQSVDLGIWVMVASIVSSLGVARYVQGIARRTKSMALLSNGQHLMVDFWTSVGVLAALVVTRLTGWKAADPVFAIGLAVWLALNAWRLSVQAFHQLIDRRLSDDELKLIEEVVHAHPGLLSYHRLRTRLSGAMRYIDMHIVVPNEWSVVQAHECADMLEKTLEAELAPAQVVIHVDPFDLTKQNRRTP